MKTQSPSNSTAVGVVKSQAYDEAVYDKDKNSSPS